MRHRRSFKAKLRRRIQGLPGRRNQEINRADDAVDQVKCRHWMLRTVRDLLGVEGNREIHPWLLELVQR